MKLTKRLLAMMLTVVMVLTMLPAIALTASAAYNGTGTFEKATGTLTSGYYVFGQNNSGTIRAANNANSSNNWLTFTNTTVSSNKITNPATSIVWYYDSSAGTLQCVADNSYVNWPTTGNTAKAAATATPVTIAEQSSGSYYVNVTATPTRGLRFNTTGYRFYGSSYTALEFYKLKEDAPTITITAASNNTSWGTVSLSGSVITASPANGYTYASTPYTVSPSNAATVSQDGNEFTVTATASCTVTINFAARQSASITLSENGSTSNPTGYFVGDSYTLPTTAAAATGTGYTFVGWSTVAIATPGSEPTSNYYAPGASVTLAASQTYYAVYAQQSGTAEVVTWEPVTSAPSDWSGDYVIVNSDKTFAMTSDFRSGTSGEFLGASVTITNDKVVDPTDKMIWTVAKNGSNAQYSFKNKSTGTYANITGTSSTNAALSSSAVWFTIASSGTTGVWKINSVTNSARCFAWYAANTSFRTYANSTNNTGYLYKKTTSQGGASYTNYTTSPVAPSVDTYTVTVTQPSNGSISTNDTLIDLEAGDTVTLTANPNTGYEINAWTISGATHTESGNSTTITIGSSDVTATVSFRKVDYTITKNAGANGSITAAATANYQDAVSFTVTPASGYQIDSVTVKDASNNNVTVSGSNGSYSFTMPASNVTITATCSALPTYDYTFYGPNNSIVASGNAATVTAPAGSPASITYTYPGETTPTTFTFAGWVAGQAQLTTPGVASGEIIPAGTSITLSADTTYRAVYAAAGSGDTFTLSLDHSGTTYYVGPRSGSNNYMSAETSEANAAEFGIEESSGSKYLYYMDGTDKVYVSITGNNTSLSFASAIGSATAWTVTESSGTIYFTTTATGGRNLAYNYNNGSPRFASYTGSSTYLYQFTKTGGAGYLTEPGANYYAVTYNENANGDTVTNMPDNGAVQEGTSYTIPATIPVRDGYRFDGWATTAGGNVVYAASSLPTAISNVNAAINLYAHWTAVPQATVTFYAADNTTTFETASVYEGDVPTAPATNPTKAPSGAYYYTFSGWSRTAGGAVESPMTAIASGESTRAYYPVFTQNVATFTLTFSGRTKVATEGSFNTAVLQPVLSTEQEGCSAVVTGLTINSGTNNSIATVDTSSNALTVTGVSAGTLTLNVTATFAGGSATGTVIITVIDGNGGASGGYQLITKDVTGSDVSDYDWTGEYIFTARELGTSAKINTWRVMTFDWTDSTTATIGDGSGGNNITGFTLDPAAVDEFGVASATTSGVTISAIHTGEADYGTDPETTGQGFVFDRIVGFKDSSNNDITNQYIVEFERVDDVNNYYTIRIKGTNYYLTNSNTSASGGNGMGGAASPDSIGAQLMWHISWAPSVKPITASASGDTTATPDVLLIESVYTTQQTGNSRAIFYNQAGNGFRAYGNGAYYTNGNSANTQINSGTTAGYNVFLYGKNVPFEAEIVYDGTPRNTTTDKITVPWNYSTVTELNTLTLEGVLDPETYPGWTVLNDSIPTWTLIGAYNANGTTFSSAASVSAISGTQNANFNVANWTSTDEGKYYVVQVTYQVRDTDGITHDVSQQAMIVVGPDTNTYTTVIHEASSQSNTGEYTVPSRIGASGVDLDAYVRDNYSEIYTDRAAVNGYTMTQPSVWTYTSQKNYTYTISAAGVVTWDPSEVVTDDTVSITATASITNGETTPTVAAGSITLFIKQLAYSGEVVATPDSSVTEIPFGDTAFAVTLGNFLNNDNDAPGSSTYSINSATEWNWTASTLGGVSVPITRTSTGATVNVSGLATGTQVIVRATNVIATSNVVANTHTVVTITGKIFTVGEDNSLAAVDDSFVLDFDRDAKLNVLANDRNADGATLTLGAAPTGIILTKNNDNTITFGVPGGQLTTATYTFTYTLSKSGETDSTATVTVKPSSAIYYEDTNDDFFTYTDGTKGKWSVVGTDNAWLQDASAAADGYDAANNCLTWSAGIAHKANVGKTTDYGTAGSSEAWPTMEFTFVGNAFSISMMRNNYTGLIAVYVDGTKVKNVATAYGATGGEYDPEEDYGGFIYESSESNYGMPAFYWAASGGTAGTHSVKVQVLYSGMYDHNDPKANNYDVYIDGVTIYNPISGTTAYKYISFRDTVLATGSLGVPATQPHDYATTLNPATLSIGTEHTGTFQLGLTDEGVTVYSGYTVSYSSSDSTVARVTGDSLNTTTGVTTATVYGVGEGTATITATISISGTVVATRTVTVNVTDTVYTVTYILPNGTQEIDYTDESIRLGTNVTHLTAAQLAEYNAHQYVFRGWAPATVADTTTQPGGLLDDGMTINISSNPTYYAVYTYGTSSDDFQIKTDLSTPLVDGETIVIYEVEGTPTNYLLSNQDYSSTWNNWRLGVAASPENGFIRTNNTNLYWTVEATSGGFYLKDQSGKYLSANATDGQLVIVTTPDEKAIWNATTTGVSGTNCVYIYNNEASPKYLQHYSGYAEFCAYTYDEAWANRNEMQIYVQQPNNLTYTTNLISTITRYTVNYYVNGTAVSSEQVVEGNNPNFPSSVSGTFTEAGGYAHDYTFLGWIPAAIATDTSSAPATIYETGDNYAVNATTTFYAVFSYSASGGGTPGYSLTTAAPAAEDNIIIARLVDGTYYAMTTSETPSYSALTVNGGVVDSPANSVIWDVYDASEGVYLKPTGGSNYLHMNSTALKVTTGTANGDIVFTLNNDGVSFKGTRSDDARWIVTSGTYGLTCSATESNAANLYIFKYGTSGGSVTTYATTLGLSCSHEGTTNSIVTAATCTAAGYTTYTCTNCGATWTDNVTTALGHNYVAASNNDGTHTYTCTRCNDSYSQACIYDSGVVSGTNVTYTCTVCSYSYTTTTDFDVNYIVQSGVTYSGNSRSGNSITLPDSISIPTSTYNAHSYTLVGWATVTGDDTTSKPTCYDPGATVTISDDTNFYPVYSYGGGESGYTLVGANDVTEGTYIIGALRSTTATDNFYFATSTVSSGDINTNTSTTTIAESNGTRTVSTLPSGATEFVFTGNNTNGFTIAPKNTTNYLGYTTSSNRKLAFASSYSTTKWTVGAHSDPLLTNGVYLSCSTGTYTITENSTAVGAIRGYANTTKYRAIYLFKLSSGGTTTYTFTLAGATVADNYTGTVTATPSTINITSGTSALTSTLKNNGNTVSSGDYSVSYARTSGTAATVSGSTVTATSSTGVITVTATFTVGGNTVATATCDVTVVDPNASVTVNYVGSQNGNVYNWGTRDVTATFLTALAADYYTGSYSYSTLSALSGNSSADTSFYSSALGTAIHNMLVAKQTTQTSYDGTKSLYQYTDCTESNNSSGAISSYYSGTGIGPAWGSTPTWNREHTWPNSKGLDGADENDIMMLRPTASSENSSRGNKAYGTTNNTYYFNPNSSGQNLHGDVARLMLQHLMRWGNTSAFYGTGGVIESRAVLLQWLEEDPVDTWEMGRNDAVERITGVRNVFVDYPELAFILLGASVPSNYTTPSSSGIVASATYNNTTGSGYSPVTYGTSKIANPGIEYAVMGNEPVTETRSATRTVGGENSDLPVTGAVILDAIGEISNNDDVMSYLASYGAQNCLVIPASGSVVFYLTGGSAESQIAIGASALNGTGTTLKVYQISAVSGSSATGTILVEQSLVSSTEMYFAIDGIAWTGNKSNVMMVRNEGSAPMVLTNLRAVTGTVEGHISTGDTASVGNATRAITRGTDDELEMVIDANAILAGIAGVQSINEGTFDETPVDPVDPIDPVESDIVLRGNSISLNGQIDVNFYVDVPADLLEAGAYATLDGVRVDFTEGTYGTMVSKKLPAKEMNTKVTMKLYAADGTPLTFLNGGATVTEHSYSVQDYLTYVIGNPATYGDELVKLCKAMSDYGSYTQRALGFDVNNAKSIYLADEIAAVTCTGCDYGFTPNTENITFLGASVVTESETAIRVYFALTGEGFTATVDGEPAAIQTNERGTFVEIANISAKNLGDTHTIVITNGSESVTVSDYSVYSYVQSVLGYAEASENLVLAAKALKLYGDLAAAYFNK